MRIHRRPSAPGWLALGTLAAGSFDLLFACMFWALKADVPAQRIFQSIARGAVDSTSVTSSTSPQANASSLVGISPPTSSRSARCAPTTRRLRRWMPSGATSPTCVSLRPMRNGLEGSGERAMTR